jgi:hypothetical protein
MEMGGPVVEVREVAIVQWIWMIVELTGLGGYKLV